MDRWTIAARWGMVTATLLNAVTMTQISWWIAAGMVCLALAIYLHSKNLERYIEIVERRNEMQKLWHAIDLTTQATNYERRQ